MFKTLRSWITNRKKPARAPVAGVSAFSFQQLVKIEADVWHVSDDNQHEQLIRAHIDRHCQLFGRVDIFSPPAELPLSIINQPQLTVSPLQGLNLIPLLCKNGKSTDLVAYAYHMSVALIQTLKSDIPHYEEMLRALEGAVWSVKDVELVYIQLKSHHNPSLSELYRILSNQNPLWIELYSLLQKAPNPQTWVTECQVDWHAAPASSVRTFSLVDEHQNRIPSYPMQQALMTVLLMSKYFQHQQTPFSEAELSHIRYFPVEWDAFVPADLQLKQYARALGYTTHILYTPKNAPLITQGRILSHASSLITFSKGWEYIAAARATPGKLSAFVSDLLFKLSDSIDLMYPNRYQVVRIQLSHKGINPAELSNYTLKQLSHYTCPVYQLQESQNPPPNKAYRP